ncbi:Asd/ArgC dimerization domain-containing protein [Edaphobacter modestus]|uniref:Aspartate-semialdehyde dehydrogenase n=1 Tax=Edaphobacter modestus TaxID=388466 RepID=A0A4Q7YTG1_9BACT|nr:Asd/ArgC dimerization domain-containing protein [Edaphobacter modestus]RZU40229.1 aspartate-semialdehyde dehydrogenase [Edaphobacter modestus]
MTGKVYRIGVVGASSLAGKELSDELGESLLAASNVVLLEDEEESTGQLTSAGEEAAFIQKIDSGSFEHMDFVFFAGDGKGTLRHWQEARKAGASIIDLTYALEGESEVLVMSPWVSEALGRQAALEVGLHLGTQAVIPAHPVAVMLALVAARLQTRIPVKTLAATVMEPASEHGRAAMDEMHQQTVSLLSFQELPKEQYDSQVSFNLLPSLGSAAKVELGATEWRIRAQYKALANKKLPPLNMQLVQAPVFHGYVASVFVETSDAATVAELEGALAGEHLDIVTEGSEPPSNLTAAGQEEIMVRVVPDNDDEDGGTRFWLWLAADNLKLTALHAIACAGELRRLRPSGKVQ